MVGKLEYRRQEVGDLRTDHRKDFRALTNRVGNIRRLVRRQLRAQRREVCDIPCAALRYQACGFAQCEGSVELARGKFQNSVAVCPRHGENKIGI